MSVNESPYAHMRMTFKRDGPRLLTQLRKNYCVWPVLFFAFGFAPSMVVFMMFHKGTNPDTIWSRNNLEPWNLYQNRREKLVSFVDFDYKNYKPERPIFDYKINDK
jgi:hypothetical protein